MKYCCGPETCVVCGQGTSHPTHWMRTIDNGLADELITEGSECDHCGSVTANAAQMSINKLRGLEHKLHPRVRSLAVLMKVSYPLSPHVYFDEACDPKRQKVLGLIAGELFDAQMALSSALREFNFVYATGAGSTPFHYMAGLYGSLGQRIKEMKALLKKHGKQPEVVDYFRVLDSCMLGIDVFKMMKDDFETMHPLFCYRRERDVINYPHFTMWETMEIDWDLVAKNYKAAK